MRGTHLTEIPVRELRDTISILSGSETQWPKDKCVNWLTKKKIHEINVGNFCRLLLRVVVGRTDTGFPIGLNYEKMVRIARRHFPRSVVDEGHFRWYATTMRSAGEMIPVYREKK